MAKTIQRERTGRINDLPRSDRSPKISEKKMYKVKQKVIESKTGWEVKEVMNLIYEKTGVRYHEVHVRRLQKATLSSI